MYMWQRPPELSLAYFSHITCPKISAPLKEWRGASSLGQCSLLLTVGSGCCCLSFVGSWHPWLLTFPCFALVSSNCLTFVCPWQDALTHSQFLFIFNLTFAHYQSVVWVGLTLALQVAWLAGAKRWPGDSWARPSLSCHPPPLASLTPTLCFTSPSSRD